MNCPICGKPIGGYVQAGSTGASRVAQGRCPHCGCTMPSGYKVGFANDFKQRPTPTYYNADAVMEVGRKGPYKGICTILNGVLGCIFSILNHHLVIGIIFGVLVSAAAVVYYFMWAGMVPVDTFDFRSGTSTNKTKQSPINNGLMIGSLFAGLTVSLCTAAYPAVQPDRTRFYWILGTFGVSLLMQAITWKHNYKWAIGAAAERKKTEQETRFYEHVMEQLASGNVKCGKCGKTIYGRYSVAFKDDGAIVLCDKCFPWKDKGTTKIEDLVFHHGRI